MTAAACIAALLAVRVEPVRLALITRGVPKGQRRRELRALRRDITASAKDIARALRAVSRPARVRVWTMPGAPPAAVQRRLNDVLVAMATGKGKK